MPGIEPVTFQRRAGIKEEPEYAQSWTKVPFDDYEGMTQQQFQDSVGPFTNHGKLVPVEVPKGWRRVEGARPGKHLYVHLGSGAISRFAKETYDCKKGHWVARDGSKVSEEDLSMHPEARALQMAYPGQGPVVHESEPAKLEGAKSTAREQPAAEAAPAVAGAPLPVALLFPGQGSQYVKMMSGLENLPAVQAMLSTAKDILGYDMLEVCLQGPESKLEKTVYCQPAVYIAGLAGVEKLRSEKPDRVERCRAVAGLSLGEYTALTAAGVFDFETGLRLVKLRAEAMQEAAAASEQCMVSVAGLTEEHLSQLCRECCASEKDVCQIANDLFPKGFSCAGTQAAVERLLEKALKAEGILQAKLLKTSGGFHTPLMQPARARLLAALQEAEPKMKPPNREVYMNVTGEKIAPGTPPAEIIPMLAEQLVSMVRWAPAMQRMIDDGIKEFYECGPQKQLKAMMKRINMEAFGKMETCNV